MDPVEALVCFVSAVAFLLALAATACALDHGARLLDAIERWWWRRTERRR